MSWKSWPLHLLRLHTYKGTVRSNLGFIIGSLQDPSTLNKDYVWRSCPGVRVGQRLLSHPLRALVRTGSFILSESKNCKNPKLSSDSKCLLNYAVGYRYVPRTSQKVT